MRLPANHHPRRRLLLLAAAALVAASALAVPARGSLALFTDTAPVDGNTFRTGTWSAISYYLHNNPTPPVANTNAQANLPMDITAPTATTLRNYDANRDSAPGLLVAKGGSLSNSDLTKYQNWRSSALESALTISGSVTLDFWSAMKDFGGNKAGSVTIHLRDFNPANGTYTEIANATLSASNWQGGSSTWVLKSGTINVPGYTLQAGRQLEVRIVVRDSSGDDMWFAYDTQAYTTKLTLP